MFLKEIDERTVSLYLRDLNSASRIAAEGYLRQEINKIELKKAKALVKIRFRLIKQKEVLEKNLLGIRPSFSKTHDTKKVDVIDIRRAIFHNHGIKISSSRINIIRDHKGNKASLYTLILDPEFLEEVENQSKRGYYFYIKHKKRRAIARIYLAEDLFADVPFFIYSPKEINEFNIIDE